MKSLAITILILFLVIESFPQITFIKTYDFTLSDGGNSVIQTQDNGYLICGSTGSSWPDGNSNILLFKTDEYGKLIWKKEFGGALTDEGNSVLQTDNGDFIMVGYWRNEIDNTSDLYIVRTDKTGNILWEKKYGGPANEAGYSICSASSNYFAISGYIAGSGIPMDVYLVLINENGDTSWTRHFGTEYMESAFSVIHTSDNGFITCGTSQTAGVGKQSIYLVKTNFNGNLIWEKFINGFWDYKGRSILQINNGDYIVCGFADYMWQGYYDNIYYLRLNEYGEKIWSNHFGTNYDNDYGYAITQTHDNNYIICGSSQSLGYGKLNVALLKINGAGETLWYRSYGNDYYNDDGLDIKLTNDHGFIIVGNTYVSENGHTDVYLIKTDSAGWVYSNNINHSGLSQNKLSISPNPFSNKTTIEFHNPNNSKYKLSVFTISGNKVFESDDITSDIIEFERGKLKPGIYVVELKGENVFRGKMIIE